MTLLRLHLAHFEQTESEGRGNKMKPGECRCGKFSGRAGIKRRPAIVVSTALYHTERPDLILAVETTQTAKSESKTDYILQDWSSAGIETFLGCSDFSRHKTGDRRYQNR